MRFGIAAVIFAIALPGLAEAAGSKSACKTRSSSMYKFCMTNAHSKQAKKACKTDYKHLKGQCK